MAVSLLHDTWSARYFALFIILAFVNKCCAHVQDDIAPSDPEKDTSPVKDFILCRRCGADVVDSGYIINKFSSKAVVTGNQTLFDNPGVGVQHLVNPLGIKFKTITVSRASCFAGTEHWSLLYSWYPGFAWKPCLCRHCGQQLGWMFEPTETAASSRLVPSENGFHLLILESLLSEKFANSLIVIPKSYKS